jgi:ATP-dependent protease ClpP protease subunit
VKKPKPRAEFRPNPARAIFLTGQINQDLVYKLTPRIVELQHESREPITIYIDSPGGSTAHATQILDLLRAPSQDSILPCHLITVATTKAQSAAATLLSSGGYAIAAPDSLIHFHGVRVYREDAITVEKASDAARDLKASNNRSAVSLARNCSLRFFFRFYSLRNELPAYRSANPGAAHEKDCFIGLIFQRLTPWGQKVVTKAQSRVRRYDSLWASILASPSVKDLMLKTSPGASDLVELESEMLKAIIAFEKDNNAKQSAWRFATEGLTQVNDDFVLLNEYIGQHRNDWVEEFCEQWKDFVLEDGEKDEINHLPVEEQKAARLAKLTPLLLPLWLFLGAICHELHEAESPLTSLDAFWLGLIDEVIGSDLPTLRKMVEGAPGVGAVRKKKSSRNGNPTREPR